MKTLLWLSLTILTSSLPVAAQSNPGRFGLGYQGAFFGDIGQGLSGRFWVKNNFGIEGNLFMINATDDYSDISFYTLGTKLIYAPVLKDNSKFYVGGEFAIGAASADYANDDVSLLIFSPLFGSEYRLQGLPEIGFNWDIGYRFNMFSSGDYTVEIKGTFVSIGVHYYF